MKPPSKEAMMNSPLGRVDPGLKKEALGMLAGAGLGAGAGAGGYALGTYLPSWLGGADRGVGVGRMMTPEGRAAAGRGALTDSAQSNLASANKWNTRSGGNFAGNMLRAGAEGAMTGASALPLISAAGGLATARLGAKAVQEGAKATGQATTRAGAAYPVGSSAHHAALQGKNIASNVARRSALGQTTAGAPASIVPQAATRTAQAATPAATAGQTAAKGKTLGEFGTGLKNFFTQTLPGTTRESATAAAKAAPGKVLGGAANLAMKVPGAGWNAGKAVLNAGGARVAQGLGTAATTMGPTMNTPIGRLKSVGTNLSQTSNIPLFGRGGSSGAPSLRPSAPASPRPGSAFQGWRASDKPGTDYTGTAHKGVTSPASPRPSTAASTANPLRTPPAQTQNKAQTQRATASSAAASAPLNLTIGGKTQSFNQGTSYSRQAGGGFKPTAPGAPKIQGFSAFGKGPSSLGPAIDKSNWSTVPSGSTRNNPGFMSGKPTPSASPIKNFASPPSSFGSSSFKAPSPGRSAFAPRSNSLNFKMNSEQAPPSRVDFMKLAYQQQGGYGAYGYGPDQHAPPTKNDYVVPGMALAGGGIMMGMGNAELKKRQLQMADLKRQQAMGNARAVHQYGKERPATNMAPELKSFWDLPKPPSQQQLVAEAKRDMGLANAAKPLAQFNAETPANLRSAMWSTMKNPKALAAAGMGALGVGAAMKGYNWLNREFGDDQRPTGY